MLVNTTSISQYNLSVKTTYTSLCIIFQLYPLFLIIDGMLDYGEHLYTQTNIIANTNMNHNSLCLGFVANAAKWCLLT